MIMMFEEAAKAAMAARGYRIVFPEELSPTGHDLYNAGMLIICSSYTSRMRQSTTEHESARPSLGHRLGESSNMLVEVSQNCFSFLCATDPRSAILGSIVVR